MDMFMKDNIYFSSNYGSKYKYQMDISKFELNETNRTFKEELIQEVSSRKQITKKIKGLPPGIQTKIYIYTMKEFYKTYMSDFGKIPIYQKHMDYVTKEIGNTILNNIHFLHLDFNTLPENKYWIIGCQCEYCKREDICKEDEYEKYKETSLHFLHNVKCTSAINDPYDLNYWNQLYNYYIDENYDIISFIRVFDPLYSHDNGSKTTRFTKETCEKYKYIPHRNKLKFTQ